MQSMIRRHIALGSFFADLVTSSGSGKFEIVAGPQFALTVIRCLLPSASAGVQRGVNGHGHDRQQEHAQPAVDAEKIKDAEMNDFNSKSAPLSTASTLERENALTKRVVEHINASGALFLTPAVADGVYVIRVVSANELADEAHMRKAWEALVEAREKCLEA